VGRVRSQQVFTLEKLSLQTTQSSFNLPNFFKCHTSIKIAICGLCALHARHYTGPTFISETLPTLWVLYLRWPRPDTGLLRHRKRILHLDQGRPNISGKESQPFQYAGLRVARVKITATDTRDFKLPPRCKRDIRSSYMLGSVDWYSYRRFGTIYRSHHQGPSIQFSLDPWKWNRQLVPKRRQLATNQSCVTFQKSEGFNK
jgi:hypothetical protein